MFKKFVVLLASLGLIFQLSGCTSKDSKGDGEEMAIEGTEASAGANDVEKVEGEQNLDIAADDSGTTLSPDALPEDALGESTSAAAPPPADNGTPAAPPLDVAISDPTLEAPTDALPPDTLGEAPSTVSEATPSVATPTEEPVMTEAPSSSSSSSMASSDTPKAEPKPVAAYRKVDQTPSREGGKLLNTVYVARAGDTWSSVNKQIYGNNKVASLKKMNPAIRSRGLKTGDKVYYNSPHRPDDDTKVITYYEDTGIAPEVYIAKSGDDLKKVAKQLLGSKDNWKELYATNDFESKTALDEGTQIKYWKSAPAPSKELASNSPAAATTSDITSPPPASADPMNDPAAMAQVPPPPPDQMHGSETAPPPSSPDTAMAPPPPPPDANMPPPPPPPPDTAMAPPPPPPPPPPSNVNTQPKPHKAGAEEAAAANPMEDDQMTTLAGAAFVVVALALFMIMRRRRKKELEQAIQDTHVG